MAIGAKKPCAAPGCNQLTSARYCEAHRKTEKKRFESTRKSSTERGYGASWQKIRAHQLAEHPLCQQCMEVGTIRPATRAHHIDRDTSNNRPDNLASMCKSCHEVEHREERAGLAPINPRNIPRSAIPLTIVCGPPGSGKTSYVMSKAGPLDHVIDLDDIRSELSGQPYYRSGDQWIRPAIQERNNRLHRLSKANTGKAWLVVSAPKACDRRRWAKMLGASEIVVMETPPDECNNRIAADSRRKDIASQFSKSIDAWWKQYTSQEGETVMRG